MTTQNIKDMGQTTMMLCLIKIIMTKVRDHWPRVITIKKSNQTTIKTLIITIITKAHSISKRVALEIIRQEDTIIKILINNKRRDIKREIARESPLTRNMIVPEQHQTLKINGEIKVLSKNILGQSKHTDQEYVAENDSIPLVYSDLYYILYLYCING